MTGDALDEALEVMVEAGRLPEKVGLGAPSTPHVEPSPLTGTDVPS